MYNIEKSIRLAELWKAGKMIGGDQDEVRDNLLAEVIRLRGVNERLRDELQEAVAAKARWT